MLKSLNIDAYVNGYSVNNLTCLDLSVAAATGCYCYDNYFYYSFYFSVLKNWGGYGSKSFMDSVNNILDKLGLNLNSVDIKDKCDLISNIKLNIDKQIPSIIMTKYNQLFYDNHYLEEDYTRSHAILISDYNTEKPVIGIREYIHNRQAVKELTRADVMAKLFLHENMVSEIWEKSNLEFKKSNLDFYSKLFKVERISESKINNYYELVKDFIENLSKKDNMLIKTIDNFSEIRTKNNSIMLAEEMRRDYYGVFTIIFEVIENLLSSVTDGQNYLNEFKNIEVDYMNVRDRVVSKLIVSIYRNKDINEDEKKSLQESVAFEDNKLFLFLQNINKHIGDYYDNKDDVKIESTANLRNFAYDATVTADSEYRPACNVINGKTDSDKYSWRSLSVSKNHWLVLDFKHEVTIHKFVINHYNTINCITKDFEVQGSDDGIDWYTLVEVKNNRSRKTIHNITPVTYRYFRLFITLPSFIDNNARIYEFEAWG